MARRFALITGFFAALLLLAACGGVVPDAEIASEEPNTEPIFGTEDTVCESAQLSGDLSEANNALGEALTECFITEVEAGRPVTVDVVEPTIEGDPIYTRYSYDGDRTLIVRDDRADEFGSAIVQADLCLTVRPVRWLLQGVTCDRVDHPGFPEAVN